jgi:ribonuclease VapC
MSGRKVLDSYALIAFMENEPGADKVAELMMRARDREKRLLLSVINWGEVYYIVCRAAGKGAAEEALKNIDTLPVEVIPVDREITQVAAEFKSKNKMSYADCFAAALAKLHKAELVTGDREFKPLAGEIKIMWLR